MLTQTGGRGIKHSLKKKGGRGKKEKKSLSSMARLMHQGQPPTSCFVLEGIHNRLSFIDYKLCHFLVLIGVEKFLPFSFNIINTTRYIHSKALIPLRLVSTSLFDKRKTF